MFFIIIIIVVVAEALAYSCFCELMRRMSCNFPHGGAMDTHFANMRSLIQVGEHEYSRFSVSMDVVYTFVVGAGCLC